jgi:hypothetical protein
MNKLLLFLAGALVAQAAEIMSGSSELKNGVTVRYSTVLEPPLRQSQILMLEGGHSTSGNRIHRSLSEKNTGASYGYDFVVDPEGPRRFRVRIEPLTRQSGGPLMALPKYPPPQVVEQGDIIALDLLVSRDGGQKLVDYIEVAQTVEPGPAGALPPARDFTFDDGTVALRFSTPTRVYVNGQKSQDGLLSTVKPGATMWFVIPGRGRYIFSLAPHEGFQKAGAIRNHTLMFRAGADVYEVRSGAPLLGAGKAWNLYVHHDPGFEPDMKVQPPMHFGIDRMENLLDQGRK